VQPLRVVTRCLLLFCFAASAFAADLEIRYSALNRIIAEQVFTQDGRKYVKGSKSDKCQFAYLEAPRITGTDSLLKVAAKFSGRSALDVFGHCVGMGDSFDLTISGVPVPRNGAIGFKDTQVSTTKDSYYIRKVRDPLRQTFDKDFKIEIRDQAKRLLEQPHGDSSYQQELKDLDLSAIRVTAEALVLVVDFKLVVK